MMQVKGSDTIEQVHVEIQRKQAVDANEFYLVCGGIALASYHMVSDCGIRPYSLLEMMPQLRGGMNKVGDCYCPHTIWCGLHMLLCLMYRTRF